MLSRMLSSFQFQNLLILCKLKMIMSTTCLHTLNLQTPSKISCLFVQIIVSNKFSLNINKEVKTIKHNEILEMFEAQPIISFCEGKTKYIPKKKEGLYYLLHN